MLRKLRRIVAAALLLTLLGGCAELQSYRPIDDIHDLDGRRVGVGLAWAADYLLTGRDDLTLMRYDDIANLVTALCYRRLDVIAVERSYAVSILGAVDGLREVEPVVARTGLTAYVANEREDVLEQLNEFAVTFRETEEFADLDERLNGDEEYEPREIELIGGGETLRVSVCSDNYPFTYLDFESGEHLGCDIEFITHFANEYGYDLEITGGDYNAMELSVVYGKADVAISGISDLYRADTERSGRAKVTDSYMENDIVFVEIADPDKLKIVGSLDI